jgi:periplasmic divalent cation tolerance protein
MPDMILVLTTVPDDERAEAIPRALVEERLAACVNIHGPMISIYRWKGAIERESERQLVIKTTRDRLPAVQARIAALHSYELPEFIVIAVEEGSAEYLEWVAGGVRLKPDATYEGAPDASDTQSPSAAGKPPQSRS